MPKNRKRRRRKRGAPYSLFEVLGSNGTTPVFIVTTATMVFAVNANGYQDQGDYLLAEWNNNHKLGALYEAKEIRKKDILLGRCLKNRKGYGTLNKVRFALVEDLR